MSYLMVIIPLLWSAYIVALIIWVIMQKRSPVSTLSWILALAALPYIGFIIYNFFGPKRIERRRLQRQAAQKALLWYTRGATGFTLPSNDLQHLIKLGSNAGGLASGTCIEVKALIDGSQTYAAIFAAIESAKHHIHLEYYIVEPDITGLRLRDLLVEKAQSGVSVRLLVDALGSGRLNHDFLQPLYAAGGKVAFFHPVLPGVLRMHPLINLRTHRKIVVIDDWTGFTGGINITDEENDAINANAFHDTHLQLYGDAVRHLQRIFWEDWYYTTGEEPPHEPPAEVPPLGKQIVHILSSGPDTEWAPIHRVYLSAIATAQQRVWLTTPYFVPDESALSALTSAALRGLDVRILVPRMSNSKVTTYAARSYYDELTRAGVTIYEYSETMLHTKSLIIDDDLSFVGSFNFDSRSFMLNFEVCAMVDSRELTATLAAQFEEDRISSQPVLKDRDVSRIGYLGEAVARLLGPVL